MDVLEFLVSWMTDGEATIQSDWYDNIGAINKTGIMTGKELRLGDDHTGELPEVSFAQVYQFLNRSFNLFMTIQGTPGNRVVRIEDQAFFRDTTAVITLNLLDEVEESIKQELLYSHVKFGGEETLVSDTPDFPIIPLLGHQIEEFHLQGTCNINNTRS